MQAKATEDLNQIGQGQAAGMEEKMGFKEAQLLVMSIYVNDVTLIKQTKRPSTLLAKQTDPITQSDAKLGLININPHYYFITCILKIEA